MNTLTELIAADIKRRGEAKLVKVGPTSDEQKALLLAGFEPAAWLDDASSRAHWASFATHTNKAVHGDCRTTPMIDSQTTPAPWPCLSSVGHAGPIDIVGTSAAHDVARMLLMDAGQGTLFSQLQNGDYSALEPFTDDAERLNGWVKGLLESVSVNAPQGHKLGKEVYWPVEGGYHLLTLLTASSFYDGIHQHIQANKWGDEAKAARQARSKGLHHPAMVTFYPDLAILGAGRKKGMIRSHLNGKRGGFMYLFPCTPPDWHSEKKPPVSDIFYRWGDFDRLANKSAKELREFLLSTGDYNNVNIRRGVSWRVNAIIADLIQYVADVRARDWTDLNAARLPKPQRLILDPASGEDALNAIDEVAFAFGRWLSSRLREKDNRLNAQKVETDAFAAAAADELKSYLEVVV
ncbi:type I-F CRISPR-associated protein Csy1 [Salmonella enterica]|nr:type I-F CRISPR-associated protein Csy1 [Salmonella enterica]